MMPPRPELILLKILHNHFLLPPPHDLDNLYNFFWTPKTSIKATFKMTYYPIFFLNKGRILALWVMYIVYNPKKQFKVQIIGISVELDSFY